MAIVSSWCRRACFAHLSRGSHSSQMLTDDESAKGPASESAGRAVEMPAGSAAVQDSRESSYFMESEQEALRLDVKTDPDVVAEQARWAGVVPGTRIIEIGSGAGKTTQVLHQLAQPGGTTVGLDSSPTRVDYATKHYGVQGLTYLQADALKPLSGLGRFDLAWIRFLLEYYSQQAFGIARNAYNLLDPGGTLCLIDLDHNCLSYFGGSERLERTMQNIVLAVQKRHGFDPYVGRKLYAYLYDLGCEEIEMRMAAHHLIYGELSDVDRFNWLAKAEAVRNLPDLFAHDYPGGYQEFLPEFTAFLEDRRRFIYTPLIMCKGRKPLR